MGRDAKWSKVEGWVDYVLLCKSVEPSKNGRDLDIIVRKLADEWMSKVPKVSACASVLRLTISAPGGSGIKLGDEGGVGAGGRGVKARRGAGAGGGGPIMRTRERQAWELR